MTDLAGVNRTYVFVVGGQTVDPNAPYVNSTGAALLTLYEFNAAGIVTEAAGAFADNGGVLSLALPGAGQFVFAGDNAFTGAVTLAGSTLVSVQASGALGSGAISFLARSSAKLESQAANFTTGQALTIQAGAVATLEAAAGDTLTLTGAFDDEAGAGAALHIGSASDTGTVVLAASAASEDVRGALSLDGGTLKIGSAAAASLISALTGVVTINGTLDLNGQNLTLQSPSGAGHIVDSGALATLTLLNSYYVAFSGSISGALALNLVNSRLTLTGATAYSGGTTIGTGSELDVGGSIAGNIVDDGTLKFNGTGSSTYSGALTGSGTLDLTAGPTTLTGDLSQFNGTLSIDASTLTLAPTGALSPSLTVRLAHSATLEAKANETVATTVFFDSDDQIYIEAAANATLTFLGGFASGYPAVVHLGSATNTGTIVGSNANYDYAYYANYSFEIDGGTVDWRGLPLSRVVFKGTTGKLITDQNISASSVAGSTGEVDLVGGGGGGVSFTGGGETVKFASGANSHATLSTTGSLWDTVYGSSGTVTLDDALASVVGGGDFIQLSDAVSVASLYDTNGNWDFVQGVGTAYLTNAQATFNFAGVSIHFVGSGDAASLYNAVSAWDTVYGSNGTVDLTNAQASIVGGDDVVYLLGNFVNAASLYNTGSTWDTVYGAGGTVSLTAAKASIVGAANTVYLIGNSGDVASLFHTNFGWDTVYGSHGLILLTDAQASVVGGGNTVSFDGSATDFVSLYSTGGTADTVNAVNGGIILNGASANIVGHDDTIIMLGGATATQTLTGSNTHNAYYFQEALGLSTIAGFTARDAMVLSKADFGSVASLFANAMAQVNNDTVITLDASDKITLTGVQKASLSQAQFSLV